MLRWLRVPLAVLAAYVASMATGTFSAFAVNAACPGAAVDDLGMCEASWFPSALITLAAFTAALFGFLAVTWTARAAPTRQVPVAALTLGIGCIGVVAYSAATSLWVLAPAATLSGTLALGRVRRRACAAT